MLVATGSASSCHTGSVASTQPPRVSVLRGRRELRDRRRLAQPQRRERERLVEVGALTGGDAEAVLVRDVQRLALGQIPRDALVAAAGERALQVLHDRLHHRRIDAHAREPRELLGVDLARRHRRTAAGSAPGTRSSGLWSSSVGSATSAAFQPGHDLAFYASRTDHRTSRHGPFHPYAGRERPGRERSLVALFDENVTITPAPRRRHVARHGRRHLGARRSRWLVLLVITFLPTSYVIQRPGPGLQHARHRGGRRRRPGAAHLGRGRRDLPDRRRARPSDGAGRRQPRAHAVVVRARDGVVRPEQGRAADRRGLPRGPDHARSATRRAPR